MEFLDTREIINSGDIADAILAVEQEINDDPHPDQYVQEREELEELQAIESEGFDTFGSEWYSNIILIREDYFKYYAMDLAEDVGYLDGDSPLSMYIDWEKWGSDLQMDYSVITIDGNDYYGRT